MYQPTLENQVHDRIYKTAIQGLWYVSHQKNGDHRGFFSELSLIPDLEKITGFPFKIQQINQARSEVNVTRGIHCENWNKLITVIRGSCFCAIVDITASSPTYKQVETIQLGDGETDLAGSLFISKGLGNSLCITKGPVDYVYAVDALYRDRNTTRDQAISLFDPELAIPWPISQSHMIISQRDQQGISLSAYQIN